MKSYETPNMEILRLMADEIVTIESLGGDDSGEDWGEMTF